MDFYKLNILKSSIIIYNYRNSRMTREKILDGNLNPSHIFLFGSFLTLKRTVSHSPLVLNVLHFIK